MISTNQIPKQHLFRFWQNAEMENYIRLRLVVTLMLLASITNLAIVLLSTTSITPLYLVINIGFTIASIAYIAIRVLLPKLNTISDVSPKYINFSTSYIFVISACAGILAGLEPRIENAIFFYLCGLIVPSALLMTKLHRLITCIAINVCSFIVFSLWTNTQTSYFSFFYAIFGLCALIVGIAIVKRQLHISQFLISIELERHNHNLESILQERTAELTAAKEKAEESDRLKSAFISNLNHELRTPLNGIVGFVSLLGEGNLSPEKVKRFTTLIQANANHLLKIVSDILDIARIQSNQVTLKVETISIIDTIKNLQTFSNHELTKLNKKNVEIQFDEAIADIYINTDSARLIQVLQSIISNSLKFTTEGSVNIHFTTERDNAIFTISDTGIGISQNHIQNIFEPFRQGDDSFTRTQQGTGLGLAIAYKLVQLMNGEILIKSELNKGTVFSVILNQCIINQPAIS